MGIQPIWARLWRTRRKRQGVCFTLPSLAPVPLTKKEISDFLKSHRAQEDGAREVASGIVEDVRRRGFAAVAKIREEGEELAEALEKKGRREIIWEACDVLYHALAAVRARGISLSELERELGRRNKKAHKAKAPLS